MARLNIPESAIAGLELLFSKRSQLINDYANALSSFPFGTTYPGFFDGFVNKIKVSADEADSLAKLSLSLVAIHSSNFTIDELTNEVWRSLADYGIDEIDKKVFVEWFPKILKITLDEDFQLTRKGVNLIFEREKTITDFKIYTDVRPIFNESTEEMVLKAANIIYTLKLSFTNNDGEFKKSHLYFGFDKEEIKYLKEEISRAEKKAKFLQQNLANTKIVEL